MAKLELVFNCLHMFVTDAKSGEDHQGTVHVLMPATTGHGPGHEHLALLFHNALEGDAAEQGVSIRGWALEVGDPAERTADTRLLPLLPGLGETIVDLTTITGGNTVPRDLVRDGHHPLVAARVTLHGGRLTSLSADSKYEIDGTVYTLANQATWEIVGIPHELRWIALQPAPPTPVPLDSLLRLRPEHNLGYRLGIHHVTPRALSPGPDSLLTAEELKHHFAMFYPLVGVNSPAEHLLPKQWSKPSHGVNCGTSAAKLSSS